MYPTQSVHVKARSGRVSARAPRGALATTAARRAPSGWTRAEHCEQPCDDERETVCIESVYESVHRERVYRACVESMHRARVFQCIESVRKEKHDSIDGRGQFRFWERVPSLLTRTLPSMSVVVWLLARTRSSHIERRPDNHERRARARHPAGGLLLDGAPGARPLERQRATVGVPWLFARSVPVHPHTLPCLAA